MMQAINPKKQRQKCHRSVKNPLNNNVFKKKYEILIVCAFFVCLHQTARLVRVALQKCRKSIDDAKSVQARKINDKYIYRLVEFALLTLR